MRRITSILIAIFFVYQFVRCTNSQSKWWTDDRINELKISCSQTDTVKDLVVIFLGFGNEEFDSILVKEFSGSSPIDSFQIYVGPAQHFSDIESSRRSARIERTLNIHNSYHFIIPRHQPFVLANMKMVIWDLETSGEMSYECTMGDYTIDGEHFPQSGNPTFIKKQQ